MLHLKARFKVKRKLEKNVTIGRVAQQVGVRPSAIRYYEGQKILKPPVRGANGYRFYTDEAVKLLRFVRRAQALGITLKEIKPLLDVATRGQQPCVHVQKVARTHLRDINNKILELEALRKELRTLLRGRSGEPTANAVCPMIERAVAKGKSKTLSKAPKKGLSIYRSTRPLRDLADIGQTCDAYLRLYPNEKK